MRIKFRKTQMTRKRVWKNFQVEVMEAEARSVNWSIAGEINSRTKLEEAVRDLECKIKQVMEKVAPMKTLEKKRKRSQWLTPELKKRIENVRRTRMRYMESGCEGNKEA